MLTVGAYGGAPRTGLATLTTGIAPAVLLSRLQQHPGLQVDLSFEDRYVNEAEQGIVQFARDHLALVVVGRARLVGAEAAGLGVGECILEKVTDIAMGTEIDKIGEFEDIDCRHLEGRLGLELAGLLE